VRDVSKLLTNLFAMPFPILYIALPSLIFKISVSKTRTKNTRNAFLALRAQELFIAAF